MKKITFWWDKHTLWHMTPIEAICVFCSFFPKKCNFKQSSTIFCLEWRNRTGCPSKVQTQTWSLSLTSSKEGETLTRQVFCWLLNPLPPFTSYMSNRQSDRHEMFCQLLRAVVIGSFHTVTSFCNQRMWAALYFQAFHLLNSVILVYWYKFHFQRFCLAVLEKSEFKDESQFFRFYADEETEGTGSKSKQLRSDFKLIENILAKSLVVRYSTRTHARTNTHTRLLICLNEDISFIVFIHRSYKHYRLML